MKSADLKQSGFAPMLKNAFKRNILLTVLMQLAAVFSAVVITTGNMDKKPLNAMVITYDVTRFISVLVFIIGIFMALLMAYLLFRNLYSRRASDFLLAMPVKRSAFFNANYLFGIINIAASFVLSFAVTLLIVKTNLFFPSEFYIFDVAVFCRVMIMMLFAVAAMYSVFVMCAVISGRKWHFFLFSYIAVSGVVGTAFCLLNYIETIWGLWIQNSYEWVVSPVAAVLINAEEEPTIQILACVAFAVQAVLTYIAGFVLFKRRKAEVAETTVSGWFVPSVLFTLIFASDVLYAFSILSVGYWSIISAVISVAISAVVLSALFYRKAMNKLVLKCAGVAVVIAAVAICCVQFLPKTTGYIDYVPETAEVESVTVRCNDSYTMTGELGFMKTLTGSLFGSIDEYAYELSSDEAKEAVSVLHKKMISDEALEAYKDSFAGVLYDSESGDGYVYDASNGIRLEYKLKNGKTVCRTYSVNASAVNKEFAALMRTDEFVEDFMHLSYDKDILFAEIADYNYDVEVDDDELWEDDDFLSTQYVVLDDYSTLLSCIKSDVKHFSDEDLLGLDCGFDNTFYKSWDDEEAFYVEDDHSITIYINYFSETAPQSEKEKMLKMTPEEIEKYNSAYMEKDFFADPLISASTIGFDSGDSSTIKYLKSLGYKINLK